MNKLIAICYFVLTLYGCDVGGSTFVHRTSVDGIDTLYSEVVAQPGVAHFACLGSASGRCYYTVFPRDCASLPGATVKRRGSCLAEPVERFALAKGSSRRIADLPNFRLCVSSKDGNPGPDCEVSAPIAAR